MFIKNTLLLDPYLEHHFSFNETYSCEKGHRYFARNSTSQRSFNVVML